MSHPGALSASIMVSYSALTVGWIGILAYWEWKPKEIENNPQVVNDTSEAAKAKRLVTERYGASLSKQDDRTGKWWIVTEAGEILGSGDTEGDAWIHSVVVIIGERYSISVER